MSDNVKLMFEVEDLRNASPATVSRAGIIFVSESDLDWEPVLKSWLKAKPAHLSSILGACFSKYIGSCDGPTSYGHLFHFINKSCKPVVHCPRVGVIKGSCSLLDGLIESVDALSNSSAEELAVDLERLFLYAMAWSVGGVLEAEDRLKFTNYLLNIASKSGNNFAFPPMSAGESLFEYRVDTYTMGWVKWEAPAWEYPSPGASTDPDFSTLFVPTVESTRAASILSHMHAQNRPTLLTGDSGTSKTSIVLMFFNTLQQKFAENLKIKKFSFSSATTLLMFQTGLDAELDKRGGKSFGPPGGKKMMIFLDDLMMPEKNEWGDQPTLELVRQLLETNNLCFLDKDKRGDLKSIEDVDYVGAMGHPKQTDIPNRLKRHFFIFNILPPSSHTINAIYGQMLRGKFSEMGNLLKAVLENLPDATVYLWNWMRGKMLPSPSKFHYLFNLRDLARVFQGILHTPKASLSSAQSLLHLWRHECFRVFSDKLTNKKDKDDFEAQLDQSTQSLIAPLPSLSDAFSTAEKSKMGGGVRRRSYKTSSILLTDSIPRMEEFKSNEPFFVDFLRDEELDSEGVMTDAPKQYEQGSSLESLRNRCELYLSRYNEAFSSRSMNLVLFDDALRHLMRISRCLGMPKGNILLVGVGGSGKQSLAKLASYCSGHSLFQITISKSYSMTNFMDDLRAMYKSCGASGTKMTFLFTEADIKEESFMGTTVLLHNLAGHA